MLRPEILLPLLGIFSLTLSTSAYLASFYGDSFLFQSLTTQLLDTTTVSLTFQTSSSDGLLFLALGHSQFLLIELVNRKLEVKIDLGYGEAILSTAEDQSLANLIWHDFKVIRSGGNIKLALNGKDVASGHITVPSHNEGTLKIDFGIFLGGIGGNITLKHGGLPFKYFRGCMLKAEINGRDLLHPLTSIENERIVFNVLSGCPKIFRASHSDPVIFEARSAYIALKRWTTQEEGTFECMLKTMERNGIILYNAGRSRGEFIGLEMVDGVIGASVNKGGGVVALHTTSPINDGVWHSVRFSFSPSYLDIRVDGKPTKAFIEQTTPELEGATIGIRHHNLDLTGHLYIGGVPGELIHNSAVPHSLISLGASKGKATLGGAFPGCMKNLRVNHRRKGFSDFLISNKVSARCKRTLGFSQEDNFPNRNYETVNNELSELFATYNLEQAKSLKPTTLTTTVSTTTAPEFVIPVVNITTEALIVPEGGYADLTNADISFIVSGETDQIRESNILFVVSVPPKHGYLTKSSGCAAGDISFEFTPKDIANQLIHYCHDGSETMDDRLDFSVIWNLENKGSEERWKIISHFLGEAEFISTGIALNNAHSYTLPITITAVNDPPQLHISPKYVYSPIQKTATHLPTNVLNASDPDSAPSEIVYTILGSARSGQYHIENDKIPGIIVTEFTQADINDGKMVFVHSGDMENARLVFRVSNPQSAASTQSSTAVLRITAIPLNISVMSKEIILLEKSTIILTSEYLSVTYNAEPDAVGLQCKIRRMPNLGVVEVMSSEEGLQDWAGSSEFSISQVNNGHVRYRNMKRSTSVNDIDTDSFMFTVYGAGVETSHQKFVIKIKRVDVSLSVYAVLLNDGAQERKITGDILDVNVTNIHTTSRQIQLRLEKMLQHAVIFYNDNGLMLEKGGSFTLAEARTGRVSIKVKERYTSHAFQEMVPLVSVVNNLYQSAIGRLNFTYVPHLDRILLINKGLELDEGQENFITNRVLKASLPPSPFNDKIKRFRYNITHLPVHGMLKFITEDSAETEQEESSGTLTEFTSLDLDRRKLYYRHDDSETTSDYFGIHITPILEGELPITISKVHTLHLYANFTLTIKPVNDHRPIRVVNRPFEIVRGGERLLSKDDLWYHDADNDYNDMDLTFTRRGNTNVEILNASSRRREEIFKFTQRQIVNDEVLVKHKGDDFGRFVFWVRDGKHYATGLFSISASEPFLDIVNASQLMVIKSESAKITSQNLWIKTNVKGSHKDIVYKVNKRPENGLLYLSDSNTQDGKRFTQAFTFTQQDIVEGNLVYEHSGSPIMIDMFNFEVSAGVLSTNGNLTVRAFLETHQEPLLVQKNRTIVVAQGKKVQIRKQDLRVVHPDTHATDIVYTVKHSPSMGILAFQSDVDSEEFNMEPVTEFTQSDINRGLVWYVQNDSFTYGERDFFNGVLLDSFIFDVTNGIMSVTSRRLYFDIIPNKIPLRVGNFSVQEGKSKAIIREYFRIEGHHFNDDAVKIRVLLKPSCGILESSQQVGVPLKSFTYRLATAEFLYYAHDGSDSLQDVFSVQAFEMDGKKQSDVITTFVTVIPENDEYPVIVNNTGMKVWTNSVSELSSSVLAVHDPDTGPEDINFRILPPSNGWLAWREEPSTAILNFTQAEINKEVIVFVHEGANAGGFTFQADDGDNYGTKHIFVITARPLILTVEGSRLVEAFPGTSTIVCSTTLLSSTNDLDFPNRSITFIITSQPTIGKLIKRPKNSSQCEACFETELDSFTQKDVNDGVIFFKQDAEVEKWSEVDSFVLTAMSTPAENVTDIKIMVNITYDAAASTGRRSPSRLNEGYTIAEGGKFVITTKLLDASNLLKKLPLHREKKHYKIIYSVTRLPRHGNLSISENNITKVNTTFSHLELKQNKITYIHDHSDTLQDCFDFDVYLIDKRFSTSGGEAWMVPGTFFHDVFNISITPLNDNPPKLLTKGKVLEVVDGFGAPILSDILNAVDPDNSPNEIIYSIIRPPTRGIVVFRKKRNFVITKFKQSDINEGKVLFIPHQINISESELSDGFYYGVTDGIQRPLYNFVQIKILPVYMKFTPRVMEISQGSYSTPVSQTVLNVSTNGNTSLIQFEVLQPSHAGVILVDGDKSDAFTYDQVSKNQVTFATTGNDLSKDSIHLSLRYDQSNGAKITLAAPIEIVVTPLLMQGSVFASNNGLTRLGLSALNATALLNKRNSMPVYTILQKPQNRRILKLCPPGVAQSMRRNDSGEYSHLLNEVNSFTHEDVTLGYVFLAHTNINVTTGSTHDHIRLRLSVEDGSTQPADFMLAYDVIETEPEDFSSFFDEFIPKSEERTTKFAKSSVTEILGTSTVPMKKPKFVVKPAVDNSSDRTDGGGRDEPEHVVPTSPKDLMLEYPEPSTVGVGLSWMIPIAVVIALIIVLGIIMAVVFCHNKHWCKGNKYKAKQDGTSEENRSLTSHRNIEERNTSNCNTDSVEHHTNTISREPLQSPACPGVTVTLLCGGIHPEVPRSVKTSSFGGDDQHSVSVVETATVGQSYLDDNPSTIYTPSTVYHYDDTGSMDLMDVPEVEFYATNQGNYPGERLYHARSDKFIDPDVLALYSSDESIPSMIAEKYAVPVPYRSSSSMTGSVPSGLHRTISQPGLPSTSITGTRSAASLSAAALSPQLSLLPNSGLDSNQYWI